MYSIGDMERLLTQAKDYGLQAPSEMWDADVNELISICNGVGCEHKEHIPSCAKKALNRVMAFAECSAAIHDWNYSHSDGTEASREIADKQFRANMLDEIGGRNPRFKWFKQWLALRAYEAVRKYGRSDWCIAFAENNKASK